MAVITDPRLGAHRGPAPELLGFDHVEWWVGNARHTAQFFISGFGFEVTAYAGPETGRRDRVSYVLTQGEIRFVVTSALDGTSDIAEHVRRHGDGVRVVAYRVGNASEAHPRAVARGGVSVESPAVFARRPGFRGRSRRSRPTATRCTRSWSAMRTQACSCPGSKPRRSRSHWARPSASRAIDHVVGNVEDGRLDEWVRLVHATCSASGRAAALRRETRSRPSTRRCDLDRRVGRRPRRACRSTSRPKAGARARSRSTSTTTTARACSTSRCAPTTSSPPSARCTRAASASARARRTTTTPTPRAWPGWSRSAVGAAARELGILVDRDDEGYLLQIFTETIASRPTVFFEIIQRHGATRLRRRQLQGAVRVDRAEQARRGNL